MIGLGEVLVLVVLVGIVYGALRPLRRWLEARIARALGRRKTGRRGQVVVLDRRRDGTFGREDRHE